MISTKLEEKRVDILFGSKLYNLKHEVRDSCYYFEKIYEYESRLLLMIAIPPFSKVLVNELDVALHLTSSAVKKKDLPDIFDVCDRISHYFKQEDSQEAITVEYKLRGESIVGRSLYLADVKLSEIEPDKEHEVTSRGKQLLSTYVNLFNCTCRTISKNHGIPFIACNDNPFGFVISKGNGTFHNAFHEPCSYLNLISLVHFLKHKKYLFTKYEMTALLPTQKHT